MGEFIQILHDVELDELRFPSRGPKELISSLTVAQLTQLANAKHLTVGTGAPDVNNYHILRTLLVPSLASLSLAGRSYHLEELFRLHFPCLHFLELDDRWEVFY
ncbi:hypothetical protein R3P38DRAFT_3205879 [Favolaschia claudopus]|uniref:Uncharacterized protein n=1 Tax=Favolaschia claudopus TaxID=2862362 RepID=A0AAW0ALW3_9AGAR